MAKVKYGGKLWSRGYFCDFFTFRKIYFGEINQEDGI